MTRVPHKLITCILPKGAAMPVVTALKGERGLITANVNNARGVGRITPLAYRGVGAQSEKEILTVVADAGQADDLFGRIYELARIDRPHGGIMYMHPLQAATRYALPDLPDEE